MTTASIDNALVGAWDAELSFTDGPRRGESESLRMNLLADGVVFTTNVHSENGHLPPAIGMWAAEGDQFSYWLNAVFNDGSGRPTMVVYAHAEGTSSSDRRTLSARGGSEFYGSSGTLVATNHGTFLATRVETS